MRETVSWIGLIFLYLSLGGVKPDYDDDSLQAAINAVSQRRRNIAQLHEYDPDEDGSSQSEPLAYLDLPTGDVRLEGPGYNYQMLMSQMRGPSGPYAKDDFESSQSAKDRSLEEALSEYIGNVSPDDIIELKRSAFRELADQPDNLQRLAGPRGGEEGSVMTSFRERAKPTSYEDEFRRHPSNHRDRSNVGGGGGGGGEEQSEEDLKEYFDALNTYLQYNLPLELQKSYKESGMNKRQYDNYDTGYDFFNSPLQGWSKRDKGHNKLAFTYYDDESPRSSYNSPKRLHSSERAMKTPGGSGHHVMRKRLWRDGSMEKSSLHKQRVMLKRSSSKIPHAYGGASSGARMIRSKKDSHKMNLLHEKTDPSVAKELSGIFMAPKPNNQTSKNKTEKTPVELKVKLDTTTKLPVNVGKLTKTTVPKPTDETRMKSKAKQKLGQLEEAGVGSEAAKTPLVMAKKSIDWSDYFGIDRRRKKSLNNNIDDSWLLDQYLQAYDKENRGGRPGFEPQSSEEILDKQENYDQLMNSLRDAADAIISKAIKYTGAHEGIKNEQVIDKVREQVINQLALAYDLENIRRILEEHKAEYSQEPSNFYRGISEAKKKRVTVKKEKAQDLEENTKVLPENNNLESSNIPKLQEIDGGRCSDVSSRIALCKTVISSNRSALITPCVIHSFCTVCSKCSECKDAPTERHCDMNFLELADNLCGESRPFCRYSARHVLPSMKSSYTSITQIPDNSSCDLDAVANQLMECTQNGILL